MSLLVRLIFFDIVVILRWSYSRRIGSHITISVEYMSDLLRIPIELLASHQDRPGTSNAILGHIPLSVDICTSPLIRMIILGYEIRVRLMIQLHFVLTLLGSLS